MNLAQKYGQWALVTGGSTGIGFALAGQAARGGMDVVLVARRADLLAQAQASLCDRYAVDVKTIPLDLSEDNALEQLFEETRDLEIGLLVPGAGVELNGLFINNALEANKNLLRLNSEVPMAMSHHYGRRMALRKKGAILLISSGFGYQAIPYIANYSASKAYILSLGEALNMELKAFGVDVTVLSPGLTKTAMTDNSTIDFSRLPILTMSPDAVAKIGFAALGKKPSVIAGFGNAFSIWLNRLVPRALPIKLFGRLIRKAIKPEARLALLDVSVKKG